MAGSANLTFDGTTLSAAAMQSGGSAVITVSNIYTYADPAGTAVAMAIALG